MARNADFQFAYTDPAELAALIPRVSRSVTARSRLGAMLYNICDGVLAAMRLGGHFDWDNLRQEAVTRCWAQMAKFDASRGSAHAFFYRIIRNHTISVLRREQRWASRVSRQSI